MTGNQFDFDRRGLLMVISAPSGGGKSAVLKRLLEVEPDASYSVSMTSRPLRGTEVDGKDYHFTTRGEFEKLIGEDKFYEWAEVHGNLYGTREDTVQEGIAHGKDIVLDIDVQGGISVKWRSPDAVLVFLMPPSEAVLEARLRGRGTDSEEAISLRLANARAELAHWRLYDYVVVNEELEKTVETVRHILNAERARAGRLFLRNSPIG